MKMPQNRRIRHWTLLVMIPLLLTKSCAVENGDDDDMCDVTAWYEEAESEGAFLSDEPEVADILSQVEALMAGDDQPTVLCSVLQKYDDILYTSEEEADEEVEEKGPHREDTSGQPEDESPPTEEEEEETEGQGGDVHSETAAENDRKTEQVHDDIESEAKTSTPPLEEKNPPSPPQRGHLEEDGEQGSIPAHQSDEAPTVDTDHVLVPQNGHLSEPGHSGPAERPSSLVEQRADGHSRSDSQSTLREPREGDSATPGGDGVPTQSQNEGLPPGERVHAASEEFCEKTSCAPKEAESESGSGSESQKTSEREMTSEESMASPTLSPRHRSSTGVDQVDQQQKQAADVERLSAEYASKIKDLQLQVLQMENKLLTDKADDNNNTAYLTKLENHVLRLENALLRINSSFVLLRAENVKLRGEMETYTQNKYPALPDKNTTAMSNMVTLHQDRIAELSDVITRQSDVIKALNERTELLERQNDRMTESTARQEEVMDEVRAELGRLRVVQEKQQRFVEQETRQLHRVLSSAAEQATAAAAAAAGERLQQRGNSKDTSPPEVISSAARVDPEEKPGAAGREPTVELPDGADGKEEEEAEVERDVGGMRNEPALPNTDRKLATETAQNEKDSAIQKEEIGPSSAKPDVPSKGIESKGEDQSQSGKTQSTNKADAVQDGKEVEGKGQLPQKTTEKGKKVKAKNLKRKTKKKGGKPKSAAKKVVRKKKAKPSATIPAAKYVDETYKGMKDCSDHYMAGRRRDTPQRIRPVGVAREADVFCDMRNGGWTLVMRRHDGALDFYRNWSQYKQGFGGTYGDHWIGLELLHRLTNQADYQLRVELTDWERNSAYALYELVRVEAEASGYRLHVSGYSGTAGDGLAAGHSGMRFSTHDRDADMATADQFGGGSCARRFHGAWWYNRCYKSNLTGRYYRGGRTADKQHDGVTWKPWTGSEVSLKRVEMKIKRKLS